MSNRKLTSWGAPFAVGVAAGVGILILKGFVTGDSDPFQPGWPWFLQSTAFVTAFAISWKWPLGVTSAVGLYAGLAADMLALRASEYPASSLIALAIHGFVPALVGSVIALVMRRRSRLLSKSRPNG